MTCHRLSLAIFLSIWVGKGFDDAGANNVLIYCLHLLVCCLKKEKGAIINRLSWFY